MKLFDSHCHLQFPQYDADRAEVLARMQECGMGAVVVGTDSKTSAAGIELARQHDFLWASVGLHPNDEEAFDDPVYQELAQDPTVVAVGECGLDYFRSSPAGQHERFEAHLELALLVGKPLIIHCRDKQDVDWRVSGAHFDMQQVLQKNKERLQVRGVAVVMHFFTGSGELAQRYLELGCYLSFPGPVTYADMYDKSMRVCPMDKLLIETDAPFAAPVPHRGQRNEPSFVADVAAKVGLVKGVSAADVAAQAVANASLVFRL